MIERLLCAIFGHKYVVLRRMDYTSRKVGCTRCNKKWAMHDPTKSLVEWDGDIEDFYNNWVYGPNQMNEDTQNE